MHVVAADKLRLDPRKMKLQITSFETFWAAANLPQIAMHQPPSEIVVPRFYFWTVSVSSFYNDGQLPPSFWAAIV